MINWFEHQYPYTNVHELNLDWIIKHFNEFIEEINSLDAWRAGHKEEYNQLLALYQEVKADWDNFANGVWPPTVYEQMRLWWENNSVDLVGELVRFVFFGLTMDGYFIAYIPENWRNIQFDTIATPGEDYGRLCIYY